MKYNVEIIRELAQERNWKLISEEYKKLDNELIFECAEGHRVYDSWRHVRDKWICPVCSANTLKVNEHKVIKKRSGARRVLALDQSSRISGYSIYDDKELIDYGKFETQLSDEISRAKQLKEWLISMCAQWKPDYIALEGVQYQQNFGVTTFQTLCRIQGILMECCLELGIPCEICHTQVWRGFCGVKGRTRADKKRSMQMLAKEWHDITVTDDEADAIGIGYYMARSVVPKNDIVEWE